MRRDGQTRAHGNHAAVFPGPARWAGAPDGTVVVADRMAVEGDSCPGAACRVPVVRGSDLDGAETWPSSLRRPGVDRVLDNRFSGQPLFRLQYGASFGCGGARGGGRRRRRPGRPVACPAGLYLKRPGKDQGQSHLPIRFSPDMPVTAGGRSSGNRRISVQTPYRAPASRCAGHSRRRPSDALAVNRTVGG